MGLFTATKVGSCCPKCGQRGTPIGMREGVAVFMCPIPTCYLAWGEIEGPRGRSIFRYPQRVRLIDVEANASLKESIVQEVSARALAEHQRGEAEAKKREEDRRRDAEAEEKKKLRPYPTCPQCLSTMIPRGKLGGECFWTCNVHPMEGALTFGDGLEEVWKVVQVRFEDILKGLMRLAAIGELPTGPEFDLKKRGARK